VRWLDEGDHGEEVGDERWEIAVVEERVIEEKRLGDRRERREYGANGEFRMAHMWVEGWRARLRVAGDLVERERWEGVHGVRRVYVGDVV